MNRNKIKLNLPEVDYLFSTQDQRDDMKKERIETIALSQLSSFKHHPFKVTQDDELQQLMESIRENGVLYPAIARP